MKRQEFRSWREVVVCVPGKQGPSKLALHFAAMDRNVGGPVCMFNHGDCPERTAQVSALADFWRSQSVRESTDHENQVQRDISQLRGAVCKLAAKIMWNSAISDTSNPVHRQSDGHSVIEYAVENPTVSEQVVVSKIPEVPSMERIQEQIVESIKEVPQERVQQRTVEQNVCMSVPLAAPRAATASPSVPVSVFEHATLAPVDVYTKPAPVIDLMHTCD